MLDIQEKVLADALRKLDSLGCHYAIQTPDDRTLGDLEVKNRKRASKQKVNHFKQTGYVETVAAMGIGDVQVFKTPEGAPVSGFQKAIAGTGCRAFGNGNFTTCMVGTDVQALRVG